MPILEEYRELPPLSARRYGVLALLTIMLMLVLIVILRLGRKEVPAAEPEEHAGTAADRSHSLPLPERAARPWQPLPPDEERALLGRIVDQAPIGLREHREAYYYLLAKSHHTTDAELAADLDTEVGYPDFAGQPAIVRGSVVQVRGLLLRLQTVQLSRPPEAGPKTISEGQIMDYDNPEQIYSFVLTEPPQSSLGPDKVSMADAVRVTLRGFFMQNIAYQNQANPPEYVATPLIIGRRLEKIALPEAPRGPIFIIWPVLLAILAAAFALWLFILRGRLRRH